MKIVINDLNGKYQETISFTNFDDINETFKKFSLIKEPLEVEIYSINECIRSHQLSKFRYKFDYFKKLSSFLKNHDLIQHEAF